MTARRLAFAVIGDRVASSLSPRMHRAAYAALGLDCTYDAIPTRDDEVCAMVDRVRAGELEGLNVTIPHKQRVLEYVDATDPSVGTVGTANTLVRTESGEVVAHNTDIPALALELRALAPSTHDWPKTHALVLGTGATARSAVFALGVTLGCREVTVRGRAVSRSDGAGSLEAELTSLVRTSAGPRTDHRSRIRLESWGAREAERDISVIVQATSLGMPGGDTGDLARDAVDWGSVGPAAVALDVVYADVDTPFVTAARAHGLAAASGRGMLARQGALAFELWLHRAAPLDAMLRALSA